MAKKKLLEQFMEMRERNLKSLPKAGAEFDAMFREGVKDIRQTIMEAYLGKGEHAPEIGTPMNPTQAMETSELNPNLYGHRKEKDGLEMDMG